MKKLALILLFMSGSAFSCPSPSMTEAAIFDTATTAVTASVYPNAVELSPLGFVGATILRFGILSYEDKLSEENRVLASAIWTGAGIHNIVHVLGVAFAPSIMIGIMAGLFIKQHNNDCIKGK